MWRQNMATFQDYVAFRDEQLQESAKKLKNSVSRKKKGDYLTDLAKDFNKNVYKNDYEDVAYGQSFKGE